MIGLRLRSQKQKTCRLFPSLTGPPGGGEAGADPISVSPFPQFSASARHQLTLRDHGYEDSVLRCVPVLANNCLIYSYTLLEYMYVILFCC